MAPTIPKQVLQGLKSIADETLEQGSDELKKAVGLASDEKTDLMPDIKDLSDEQKQMLESQDKEKTGQQTDQIRQELGRNVEGEIDEVRKQKQEEEDRKEQEFLEKIKAQRQAEAEERNRLAMANETSASPGKQKKARGSAFARGKKPTASEMTATGEFSKKKD